MHLLNIYKKMVARDLRLAYRQRTEVLLPHLFFIIIVALFPLAITPDSALLVKLAPGIIWIAAMMATLLSLESLFRTDFSDGCLEQMILSPEPMSIMVIAKVTAHWLVAGFPLVLISPLLGLWLNLSPDALWALAISLLLGTPILSLIGAIGVALTVGLLNGGVLLALLILPLYIPVLIFGTSVALGSGPVSLLLALLALALALAPVTIAAALRITVSQ